MRTIVAKDGTSIAFDQAGSGPTVILVAGEVLAPVLIDFFCE